MSASAGYEAKISEYGWQELKELWGKIRADATPDWPDGKALEYLVLRAFQLDGALVRWPYEVHLWDESEVVEQIDGAIHVGGLHCLVEAKDRGTPVNIEPVAKLRNQLLRRPAGTIGVVFSRGDFSNPAIKLTQFLGHEGILLWTGGEISYALRRKNIVDSLHLKYRACVEMADPCFNVAVEEVP